jgi:hypothetical protein
MMMMMMMMMVMMMMVMMSSSEWVNSNDHLQVPYIVWNACTATRWTTLVDEADSTMKQTVMEENLCKSTKAREAVLCLEKLREGMKNGVKAKRRRPF